MKKVLKTKREYHLLDFLKLFVLFFGHIFIWGVFTALLYVANYLKTSHNFITIFEQKKVLLIYLVIVSPIFSYVCHALVLEKGFLSARGLLWVHSMVVIIFAFISFIFF